MENISSGKRKKELKNEEKNTVEVKTSALERLAERAAEAIGSVLSLVAHSIFFVGIFSLLFFGFSFDQILLILTTVVSLEAIYLAIFIQMTVNRHSENIEEVREDIEDIQEDVEDISEDIEDIQEDVEEIGEDVEGIQKEVEEIGDDVEDIQKDVDDIQEDVEDISDDIEKEESAEDRERRSTDEKLEKIESALQSLVQDIEKLRRER